MTRHLGRLCLGLCVAAALSCGNPVRQVTTEQKNIVTHALYPNVMMLIDRSATMTTNTSVASPCPTTIGACGPGNPCPAGCSTRIEDVKTSIATLLGTNGAQLRVGASFFPSDDACGAANASTLLVPLLGSSQHDDDAQDQQQASAVTTAVSSLTPQGGIPTADSLRFIGTQSELRDPDRMNVVMLFTNGEPDCSGTAADAVAAVGDLQLQNIATIVIAIGADALSPAATDALNQMATAGGFPRTCLSGSDAECGSGDTCNTTTFNCSRAFFPGTDAQQLTQQLLHLTARVPPSSDICTMPLEKTPSSASDLEVIVDQAPLGNCESSDGCNTWTFDAPDNAIQFQGLTCLKLENAVAQQPVSVTIKIFGD